MSEAISVLDGSRFVVSDARGDIVAAPDKAHGLFHKDTRFLSTWKLTVNGVTPSRLPPTSPTSSRSRTRSRRGARTRHAWRVASRYSSRPGILCSIGASPGASGSPELTEDALVFPLVTPPKSEWSTCIEVRPAAGEAICSVKYGHGAKQARPDTRQS